VADSSVRLSRSLNLRYLSFSRSPSSLLSFSLYICYCRIFNFHHFPNSFSPLFSTWSRVREPIVPQIRGLTVTAIIGHSSSSRVCVCVCVYIYIYISSQYVHIFIFIYLSHIIVISSRILLRFSFFNLFREVHGVCRDPPRAVAGDERIWNEFAKTRDETSRKLESEFFLIL